VPDSRYLLTPEQLAAALAAGTPPYPMSPEVAYALRTIMNVLRMPRDRLGRLQALGSADGDAQRAIAKLAVELKTGGAIDAMDQAQMILAHLLGDMPQSIRGRDAPPPDHQHGAQNTVASRTFFDLGREAKRGGKAKTANPYPDKSRAAQAWLHGFTSPDDAS
jgi:hypothetical protein